MEVYRARHAARLEFAGCRLIRINPRPGVDLAAHGSQLCIQTGHHVPVAYSCSSLSVREVSTAGHAGGVEFERPWWTFAAELHVTVGDDVVLQ
jgi:hypothetical protein